MPATFPDELYEAIDTAARRYLDDIPKAVAAAERKLRTMPEFDQWVTAMVTECVKEMVYRKRAAMNAAPPAPPPVESNGHANNGFHAKPKIDLPDVINTIARRINLEYLIGGKRLGSLLGAELPELSTQEAAAGETHLFLSRLLSRLADVVPADKAVRDAVSEKRLAKIIDEVEGRPANRVGALAGV
mgnify:CR=1 FL=1